MEASKLRVLHISTVRFGANGITAFIMNYYRHLDPAAAFVGIVVPNEVPQRVLDEVSERGGRIYVLPNRNRNPLGYGRRLSAIVREGGYDVVHAHGNSTTLYVEMRSAAAGGARVRIPHSHNTSCKMKLANALLRPLFDRSYTNAMACGQEAGEWLFRGRPFTVANNAIDTARFAFNPEDRRLLRQELGWEDGFVLCHVGTFNQQKNHRFLLDVFTELHKREPRARLLLVGDGQLRGQIELTAYRRGLSDAVYYTGAVPNAAPYLSCADAFVLPSLHEGLPFTLIEAQCSGLPCFDSDVITQDAVFTPLVTPLSLSASPADWAGRILEAGRPAREAASADAAKAIADAHYSIDDNAARLLGLYRRFFDEANA